ncbi:Tetratricopeptide-like helical [Penicillium griseofulvum]|uniref:Tetratricopeptide-like helical n=1 Tax=Penicillium patulum TaxID=5078 RepID=A0A135LYI1_PENPA|nr:Tetratricopeptide-like helical [Penicillium griseofulvum]KXG54029.1 Tetratricopeptide-like helical [Penicillium griseofulvum]
MSLKQEIETWVQALDAYDNQEFEVSLRCFDQIADTSKILFNCGVIYATLGEHHKAVECYQRAVGLDRYLAIAYFQQGVSNFLLGDFEEALANFNDTLLYLRGNTSIDYEQLGLMFRLFSCEVLFNRGLCYIYLRQMGPGIQDLEYAAKEKFTPDHDVIDDAIRENADGYTVFSIPVGVLYRPNAAKVKNLKTKDYLGKARLVAASDRNQSSDHQWNPMTIDKEALQGREGVSFAASHLVRQNLSSRTRQQSEPPLNRNVFPPTPPPDDRSVSTSSGSGGQSSSHHRSSSLRGARPPRLDLDRAGASLDRRPSQQELAAPEKPRIGTTRTASEPRGPSSRQNMRGYQPESSRRSMTSEQAGHRRNQSDTNANPTYPPAQEYGHTDPYDPYSSQRNLANTGWGRGSRHQPPQYIDEEEEYASDVCDATLNDGAFELIAAPQAGPSHSPQQRRTRSPTRYSRHANPRRPEIQKFRTKVHAPDDTRYIMIGPSIEFGEFENRIREKFGFNCPLKMKVQDDGDMITMVDQEDLDLLVSSAKEVARREGSEMGKIEIWVEERTMI